MNVIKHISEFNHKPSSVSRIKYIVIHYCGSLGSAKQQVEYFAAGNRNASAHYFVDFNGDVYQSVEDKNIAWHCGAKKYRHPVCRNANSLGIEMCCKTLGSPQKADEHWYFEDATVKAATELTKELMKKYNVPASNVLRHYDVTGKCCPAPYVFNSGKHTWKEFQNAINTGAPIKENTTDDAKTIWDYLRDECGLNEYATAGIMGNLYAESGLKSTNLQNSFNAKLNLTDEEYTKQVDSGVYPKEKFIRDSAGYGLAQWTYWSRKYGLYEFCHNKKRSSIGDLRMQLEYFWYEVSCSSALLKTLNESKSVLEASNAILHVYEKPADQSKAVETKRASYGDTFYKLYAKKV